MEFISRISKATDPYRIVEELSTGSADSYDLGFLFVSELNKLTIQEIALLLRKRIKMGHLIGCSSCGVIGTENEIERKPASVLILGRFPGVKIVPFSMRQAQLEALKTPEDWYNFLEVYPSESPVFIVLPDPFAFDMNRFLDCMNKGYPHCSVMGGMASGGFEPGENILILDQEQLEEGLVGVVLTGDILIEAIVSQGCRPIGETFIVTKVQDNIIYELAGKPLLGILQEVLHKASPRDKLLAQEALFVGIAMDEYRHEFKRGDFLIRGLIGLDQTSGAGAIADRIQTGQTVQFHLRDAAAATEELNDLLKSHLDKNKEKPKGALVFSCNGRGENLFRQRDHDIRLIQQCVGPVPAAGFFCAGEIGPVCKNNFLHGFTSSIALFYPK